MRNRLIATMTICSLAAGIVTAPAATAAPVFETSIVKKNGTNTCVFGEGDSDDEASKLFSAREQYETIRASLRKEIRQKFPDLAEDFAKADAITGTGESPQPGSVDNAELAEIIARVSEQMTARNFNADEVYLAFHHSPKGEEVRNNIKPQDLVLLPDLDITEARKLLRVPAKEKDSIASRVNRFLLAAANLRDWAHKLQDDSSLAMMGTVNAEETNKLLATTKNITAVFPEALRAITRASVNKCVSTLTNTNALDGTTSSQFIKDPLKGTSSDPNAEEARGNQGNFFTGSAELSSGKNTSSVDQYKELSSGDSSDDKERSRKISLLLATVGLFSFIINLLVKASPLAKLGAQMFADFLKKAGLNTDEQDGAKDDKQDAAAATPAPAN